MTKPKTKTEVLPLEARVAQCINDFKAPTTTQDALDQLAAEFATANLLRSYAEKRYNTAKEEVLDLCSTEVATVRNAAVENMMKSTESIAGEDWLLTLEAKKPATRVDIDELRTELVKCGVSVSIIDTAIAAVTKKSTPALTVAAVYKNGNRK